MKIIKISNINYLRYLKSGRGQKNRGALCAPLIFFARPLQESCSRLCTGPLTQGTGTCCHRRGTIGSSMDRTPGHISFGQSGSRTSRQFGILQGPHPGTPTPVPFFFPQPGNLHCRLNTYRECRTPPRMHFRETRPLTLPLLVPQAGPTPSHISSTLLLAVNACWTSPHCSGPSCSGHCL